MKTIKKTITKNGNLCAYNYKLGKYEEISTDRYGEAIKASYYDENSKRHNKPAKHGKTLSFEFEVGYDDPALLFLSLQGYDWLRTNDSTVAVEYKTPIFNSLRGIRPILKRIEETHPDMDGAGSHINFGHKDFTSREMNGLRQHFKQIFEPMDTLIRETSERKVANFFGRELEDWATSLYDNCFDWNDHTNWINLQHSDWIECRLPRFESADQYMRCIAFCWEMMDILLKGSKAIAETSSSDEVDKLAMLLKWNLQKYLK